MEEIGKLLEARRIELGLSIAQMSSVTLLRKSHLIAIEAGDLDALKEETLYVYYFVRKYCQELDIEFQSLKEKLKIILDDYNQRCNVR